MSKLENVMQNLYEELKKNNPELVEKIVKIFDDHIDHKFDANSDKCKECDSFEACRIIYSVKDKIKASEYSDGVKKELVDFIGWIHHEYTLIKTFDVKNILNKTIEDSVGISAFYLRFEGADNHLDKLVAICDENELKYIRKVIREVNNKIDLLCETIMNDNRAEMNNLIDQLRKPQQETKRYEDMTREELLEELKKK